MLKVDNAAVRAQQLDKLARLKAERDPAAVEAALKALDDGARGDGNLLALSIDAARAKATVGEISYALEKVFGRHKADDPHHRGRLYAGSRVRPASPPAPRPWSRPSNRPTAAARAS